MRNSSDRDSHRSALDGPWWPLDLIRSIGRRVSILKTRLPYRSGSLRTRRRENSCPWRKLCARGWALIEALLPTDFVGSVGASPEACDIYAIDYAVDAPGPPTVRTVRRLQISLMFYHFAGQPPILMIRSPRAPDGPELSWRRTRPADTTPRPGFRR